MLRQNKEIIQLHVFILTLNEEQHIERCIKSVQPIASSILVVDSQSTDRTVEIAERLGAQVIVNPFVNHASQVQHAIDHLRDRDGWVFRIDADEILLPRTQQDLLAMFPDSGSDVVGLLVKRQIHFMGKRVRYGAIEPSWQLRIFRNGHGKCEQRWMDEHIVVSGPVAKSKLAVADINLNSLTWWVRKHNSYASKEAIEVLNKKHGFLLRDEVTAHKLGFQAKARRFMKNQVYARTPSGVRAWVYFLYRYFFRLGVLDGKTGFLYHFLQALWYRTLVDAKVLDIESWMREHDAEIIEAILDRTGIEIGPKQRTS